MRIKTSTLGNGLTIDSMELEFITSVMGSDMKENFKTEHFTVLVFGFIWMVSDMKDNGKMGKEKAKGSYLLPMEIVNPSPMQRVIE